MLQSCAKDDMEAGGGIQTARGEDGIDARRRAAGLALCPRWSSNFVSAGVERVRGTLDWRIGVEARRASRHVVPSGVSERLPTMRSMACHCGVED